MGRLINPEELSKLFYQQVQLGNDPISAFEDALQDAQQMEVSRWIPVTERLPDKNKQWVLCLCVGGAMEVLRFDFQTWEWDSQYPGRRYMESYVTHWMLLPEPPEEA